ncbi:hypothetical protein Plhal703r1_c53g0158321 [Plasmopara halstedii]
MRSVMISLSAVRIRAIEGEDIATCFSINEGPLICKSKHQARGPPRPITCPSFVQHKGSLLYCIRLE